MLWNFNKEAQQNVRHNPDLWSQRLYRLPPGCCQSKFAPEWHVSHDLYCILTCENISPFTTGFPQQLSTELPTELSKDLSTELRTELPTEQILARAQKQQRLMDTSIQQIPHQIGSGVLWLVWHTDLEFKNNPDLWSQRFDCVPSQSPTTANTKCTSYAHEPFASFNTTQHISVPRIHKIATHCTVCRSKPELWSQLDDPLKMTDENFKSNDNPDLRSQTLMWPLPESDSIQILR